MPKGIYRRPSVGDRFWENVDASGECWIWTGSRDDRSGFLPYGRMDAYGRFISAHRVSWALAKGGLPARGLCVLHRCDNPPCVRPSHLFLGTHRENTMDMFAKGRAHDRRGEKAGGAKLTRAIVSKIRSEYAGGSASQYELASKYSVSQAMISNIINRKAWQEAK